MGRVRFIMKFENFHDDSVPYMYHCHMLTHEDHGMMGQFIVQSPRISSTQGLSTDRVYPLLVGPQPAKDRLRLSTKSLDNPAIVRIFNLSGAMVYNATMESAEHLIDVSSWVPSVYLLEWHRAEGVYRQKVIIN
jgi:bilirubin oxidase